MIIILMTSACKLLIYIIYYILYWYLHLFVLSFKFPSFIHCDRYRGMTNIVLHTILYLVGGGGVHRFLWSSILYDLSLVDFCWAAVSIK